MFKPRPSGCRSYADQVSAYKDLRRSSNDMAMEYVYSRPHVDLDGNIITYTVSSTKELIPPYIPTDERNPDKFTIKAGLILFHGTVHPADVNFTHPKTGSFFATTPAHSLALVCFEKRADVMQGIGYFTQEELDTTNEDYERKLYARCPLSDNPTPEEDEEYENCVEALFAERTPAKARLLTYVLKRDITVRDSPGDALSPKQCAALNCDGVLGGFNSGDHWSNSKDITNNLNELRLCRGPLEDYLVLVDERTITVEELSHPSFADLDNFVPYLTFNPIPQKFPICPEYSDWVSIQDGDEKMHAYYTVMYHHGTIDLSLLAMMLFPDSDVYYNRIGHSFVVVNSHHVKIWAVEPNMDLFWRLLEPLLEFYAGLTDGILMGNLVMKLAEPIKITLYDNMVVMFKEAGFPIEKYM